MDNAELVELRKGTSKLLKAFDVQKKLVGNSPQSELLAGVIFYFLETVSGVKPGAQEKENAYLVSEFFRKDSDKYDESILTVLRKTVNAPAFEAVKTLREKLKTTDTFSAPLQLAFIDAAIIFGTTEALHAAIDQGSIKFGNDCENEAAQAANAVWDFITNRFVILKKKIEPNSDTLKKMFFGTVKFLLAFALFLAIVFPLIYFLPVLALVPTLIGTLIEATIVAVLPAAVLYWAFENLINTDKNKQPLESENEASDSLKDFINNYCLKREKGPGKVVIFNPANDATVSFWDKKEAKVEYENYENKLASL